MTGFLCALGSVSLQKRVLRPSHGGAAGLAGGAGVDARKSSVLAAAAAAAADTDKGQ